MPEILGELTALKNVRGEEELDEEDLKETRGEGGEEFADAKTSDD